jgi:hypothetical protein
MRRSPSALFCLQTHRSRHRDQLFFAPSSALNAEVTAAMSIGFTQ